ncbi:DUF2270 domain-containing protein [Halostella sp. JP-L12]|uniref:DUF2270 domain-containing protein n=1 Tax=Halostella TaxID=1843185 RepID=UPI000EF7CDD3|nr:MULTISPECIES: DUF2270 domain-containing protein [Halostella]NHN48110.1 DUF2270 domain-containing protein [Halostella sp. JP-L12]
MARDESEEEFDPEAREERRIGREMVDDSSGLGSVVAHLYRGEMDRAVNWRGRLDSTTNWAVTIISAILAYAFSSSDVAHSIILVGMVIGVVFLLIEARRFQRYDIWRSRVRSMQENLFAEALDPSRDVEQRDWRRQLSEDFRNPKPRMSLPSALAHRLRRVYLPLLCGLLLVWLFRLGGEEAPIVEAATVSGTAGWVVFGVVIAGYVCLFALAFWPNVAATSETAEGTDRGDLGR